MWLLQNWLRLRRVCDIRSLLLRGLERRLRLRWPRASPVALMAGVWPPAQ